MIRRKKIIKFKNFIKITMILFIILTGTLILSASSNVFADSIVQNGSISWNGHKVGDFTLDGRQAFCVDHEKGQPPSGTWYNDDVYDDTNIRKTLYYGWAGEEQWSGFNGNRAKGVVSTTMLLNYYMNGGNLSSDFTEFKNFIESQPVPTWKTNFSRRDLDTHIEGNIQRTDTISVDGSNMPLRFWIDNDITLVNDNTGARYSNCDVELCGGDRVHFEAPLTLNKNYCKGDIQCRWEYPAILSITSNSSYQRIARLGAKDPTDETSITVNFKAAVGNLKIIKKDSQSNKLLAGAKFNIIKDNNSNGVYDGGDEVVRTGVTTGSDGTVTATGLVIGKYILDETQAPNSAPNKYIIKDKYTGNITVNANQTTDITVYNFPSGNIKIIKKDSQSNKLLAGAKFNIIKDNNSNGVYDGGDEVVRTGVTTGSDGTVTATDLIIGKYILDETQAPNPAPNKYTIKDKFTGNITVNGNQTTDVTVYNIPSGNIKITKRDNETNMLLAGAKFNIIKDNNSNGVYDGGDEVVRTGVTTGSDGTVTATDLIIGKYIVREVEAPTDYLISNEYTGNITVNGNQTTDVMVKDEHKKINLNLLKVDKDNHKISLGHVEFKLFNKELKKWIGKWNTIRNYYDYTDENTANKFYSDWNGHLLVENLRSGDYSLKETKTNEWYNPVKEITDFSSRINNDTVNLTIENELKKGQIQIVKYNEDYPETKIEGTEFQVLDDKGIIYETITTDKNGIATTKQYPIRDFATIYLKETKSNEKYYLNSNIIPVQIKEGLNVVPIANKVKKGKIKVVKIDEYDKKTRINGVTFGLYEDSNDNNVLDENDKLIQKMTTSDIDLNGDGKISEDEKGIAVSNEYRIDKKYFVKELSTPNNYILSDDVLEFNLEWKKTIEKTIENCPKTIQVKVHKTIKNTDIPLKGISFDVYVDANNDGIIDDGDYIIDTITTDENGNAITKKYSSDLSLEEKAKTLRVDTRYILRENTKGITLSNENLVCLNFTDYLDKEQKDIPIINKEVTNFIVIKPVKRDAETKKRLANATYDIYLDSNNNGKFDKDDTKLTDYTFTTDEEGKGNINPLPFGTYFIVEVKAPTGYNLNKLPTKLLINQEGIYNINLFDKIISSYVDIFKTTKEDSDILGIKKGKGVPDTYFSIYEADDKGKIKLDKNGKPIFAKGYVKDQNGNIVLATLGRREYLNFEDSSKDGYYYVFKTGKDGHIAKLRLLYGNYVIREVKSNPYFLNDSNDVLFKVSTSNDEQKKENKEIIFAQFNNTPHKLKIHIQKEGVRQAQPNDVIRYDFPDISNLSNVKLYNFTFEDNLPYDYVKIQKLYTGVWNEDHTFKVYYKTNKKIDWTLFGKDYSNQKVNLIDFETLGLDNVDEYVTDFKIVFDGAVKEGYLATETPFIMTKVDDDVIATDVWTNKTKDYGWDWDGEYVEDEASWDTTSYHQELTTTSTLPSRFSTKLPRTGTDTDYILYVLSIVSSIVTAIIISLKRKK